MKKILLILACFLTVFILSCGDDPDSDGNSCTSNFECPIGKVCSGGICVAEGSGDNGSGDNGSGDNGSEVPDGGSNEGGDSTDTSSQDETDSGSSSDTDTSDTSDSTGDTDHGDSQSGGDTAADTDSGDNGDSGDSGSGDTSSDTQADTDFVPGCEDSCVPMEPLCLPAMESEKAENLCNGVDDDCDGMIDEGCPCKAGETQACFSGPKNFRTVGTCRDGVQTCIVQMRAGIGDWGQSKCVGEILPSQDVCDNADNKCNGCPDHNLCCAPPIDCAYKLDVDAEGNPDPFLPFKYKIIDGKQIYRKYDDADTATWEWTLSKGPCDIVLGTVNSFVKGGKTLTEVGDINTDNGVADTVVSGVGMSQFKVKFRLSGSYLLHLKVTRENGEVYECEWVLRVVSDGLRIELCWDTNTTVDADLHLGKGTGSDPTTGWQNNTACYFADCKSNPEGSNDDHSYPNWSVSGWNYAKTTNYNVQGHLVEMNNPRLDLDNIADGAVPENINLDNPKDGDVFRVGVNFYSGSGTTHTVVNVYCGGTLKATYGVEPQVTNFDSTNDFWKVVEIKWAGDPDSDACELTPQWNNGYVVKQGSWFSNAPSYTDW